MRLPLVSQTRFLGKNTMQVKRTSHTKVWAVLKDIKQPDFLFFKGEKGPGAVPSRVNGAGIPPE
jgi:hypothetical protein